MGKHHLWILPNLTEDVGFLASFWPLYTVSVICVVATIMMYFSQYEYKGDDTLVKKDKGKKKKKDKDSDAEQDSEDKNKTEGEKEKPSLTEYGDK